MTRQAALPALKLSSDLLQQGDPDAIATGLNQQLAPQGMTVKVGWKDGCLGILLEGQSIPHPDAIVPKLEAILNQYSIEAAHQVRIYGRKQGSTIPAWRRELGLDVSASGFSSVSIMDWLTQGEYNGSTPATQVTTVKEQRFLECYLSAQMALLISLEEIQSVFQFNLADIVPVPHMPDGILGLYGYRGKMLWMVDVSTQIGCQRQFLNSQMDTYCFSNLSAIAISFQGALLGLIINQVAGIQTHPQTSIRPIDADLFSAQITRYCSGYIKQSGLPILKTDAVLRDPSLHVHQY
jgi:positive phototaxis protein PixI